MANPTEYKYRPVDWTKREIRVLCFAKPGDEAYSNSVYCSLENVLLDDFVPEFAEYLARALRHRGHPLLQSLGTNFARQARQGKQRAALA